jgi:3-oxoacyl-[acyl-carrier-protein] synthase-3
MGYAAIRNVRYRGLASCVPKNVVSNLDCAEQIKSERERLVRNIGIEKRRICYPWQCFSDLAVAAAEKLLGELHWAPGDVDALVVVTQSPDYLIPATAIIIQDRLKLRTSIPAFDINLGCSGYPYGLYVLASMMSSGFIKKGLVLIGDKCASLKDPLFSDCGTATALEYDPQAPAMHFDLNSDGSGYRAIMLPVGGHREPTNFHHFVPEKREAGERLPVDLVLDGTAVLNFSITQVPPAVRRLCESSAFAIGDMDYFVFHQANRMINETIRKKLGLTAEKTPSTLADFGNTSSASIPLTMTRRIREEIVTSPRRLLLCGFGIGLSWAGCVLETDGICMPELLEV